MPPTQPAEQLGAPALEAPPDEAYEADPQAEVDEAYDAYQTYQTCEAYAYAAYAYAAHEACEADERVPPAEVDEASFADAPSVPIMDGGAGDGGNPLRLCRWCDTMKATKSFHGRNCWDCKLSWDKITKKAKTQGMAETLKLLKKLSQPCCKNLFNEFMQCTDAAVPLPQLADHPCFPHEAS